MLNLTEIGQVIIEIQGVEYSKLAVSVNNTIVCHTVFLAADIRPCVLMKVQAHSRFLAVRQPTNANAVGLFKCFKKVIEYVKIPEAYWKAKLVAYGCDGAS